MIDGIHIIKRLNPEESPDTSRLKPIGVFGAYNKYKLKQPYVLDEKKDKTPDINIYSDKIIIKGSLPYLVNSNNFQPFTYSDLKIAINTLSEILDIDLSNAEVGKFEFGKVIEIPFPFQHFIHHHLGMNKMHLIERNYGNYFEGKERKIKLYNAKQNIIYKLEKSQKLLLTEGGFYDSKKHYAKIEIVYKNPCKSFNCSFITVSDLLNPSFLSSCVDDYIKTYKQIKKTGFIIPSNKEEVDTIGALIIFFKIIEQEIGKDIEKRFYKMLKTFDFLTAQQRHNRKSVVEKKLNLIRSLDANPYDITEILIKESQYFLNAA